MSNIEHLYEQRRKFQALVGPILGHDYEQCEESPSGKNQWRCKNCDRVSVGPEYTIYSLCPKSEYERLKWLVETSASEK